MNEELLKRAIRDLRQGGRRRPMTEKQCREWVNVMVTKAEAAELVRIGNELGTGPCETLRRVIKMVGRVVTTEKKGAAK